ncbi:MAG: sigma-54-dependent Fis family transcriptional regulator [Desulfobacterales bacterium]|nr:sigma-54-dependent Fis family transcriptional regulator [Desulfobacterales bacterium]
MNYKFSILIIDDEETALKSLTHIMRKEGFLTTSVKDGEEALKLIRSKSFDIILSDLILGNIDGIEIISEAKRKDPETEIIIITGYGSVDGAIEATKKGAFYYLQKPIRADEVRSIVRQAIEKRKLTRRVSELEQQLSNDSPTIIGSSQEILKIKKIIHQIESSDANVLITGASGTGKELIAKSIHNFSNRKNSRFLAFNCGSFTEDLLANELFGHEKDAYSGATQTRAGLLESANGGTVFFDEVGDTPATMQAKLLRAIQEKEILRVGGTKPVQIDIRIIAATNKDLKKLIDAGIFRQDLYFRLNVISIHLPTLMDRKEDIPMLTSFFLKKFTKRDSKKIHGFSEEAMGLLVSYDYPGNVRELENIVERAVSLASGKRIELNDLPQDMRDFNAFTFHKDPKRMKSLSEIEQEYIQWVLKYVGHNKTEASRILRIDRVSLYRKLKRFELDE